MTATENKKSNFRAALFLVLGSLVFGFILVEIAARLVMPAPLKWQYPQVLFVKDDHLYFRLRPGQSTFTADKPVSVNDDGLRDPRPSIAPRSDEPRILFLGDSVTFGYGVDQADAFPARTGQILESRGFKVDVVNAAVPSYNTEQEVEYFLRHGHELNPDIVVVGFHWNDINSKQGTTVNSNGRLITNAAAAANSGSDSVWETEVGYGMRNLLKSSRALYAAKIAIAALRSSPSGNQRLRDDVLSGADSERISAGWRQVDQSFGRLAEAASRDGFSAIVVIFPIPTAMSSAFPDAKYQDVVRSIATTHGLQVLDLEERFRAAYDGHESLYIPYDADHPNEVGHAVAADSLAGFLQQEGLLAESDGQ